MANEVAPLTDEFKEIELTPEQKQKWGDTMSLMAWTAPGFRHLFYKLLAYNKGQHVAVFTDKVPLAATDGQHILLNPEPFFKMELKERVFVITHEVIHNVFNDIELLHRCRTSEKVPLNNGTTLPFDEDTMQKSMDYRINALIVDSRIGAMPKTADGKQMGCWDTNLSGPNDSVLDVYEKVYKNKPPSPKGFDKVLKPGSSTGQNPGAASQSRNGQQWAVEIAAAQTIEAMKSQGKMPGALQRMFHDLLNPEVPWTDHIRAIFARRVGSGSYNWRRPDRRFIVRDIYLPSSSGFGAGWVVCWGDTSGSISQPELEKYMGELGGIIEDVRPRRLTVLWCDSKIHHVDEIEDTADLQSIKARGVGGGGGTSVNPVFDWIFENPDEQPDCFIGFTDGHVGFPQMEPEFDVVWCCTTKQPFPWGEVVRINPGHRE
jgi:predicted metal-dependent peptidase